MDDDSPHRTFQPNQMSRDFTETNQLTLLRQIHDFAITNPNCTALIRNGISINYFTFSNLIQSTIRLLKSYNFSNGKLAIIPVSDQLIEWLLVLSLRWLGLNTVVLKSLDQADLLELKHCACVVMPENYEITPEERSIFSSEVQFLAISNNYYQNPELTLLPVLPQTNSFGGHIVYTSGTTGSYKKVFYNGEHQIQRDYRRAKLQSFTQETVLHNLNLGLWTGAGFRNPTAVWIKGGCVVFDRRPDWCKHFHLHQANVAYITPQILRELLASTCYAMPALQDFTLHVTGGHLSLDLAEKSLRQLTSDLRIHYAATEVNGPVLRSIYRTSTDLFWLEPALGERIQIVDDNGIECGIGEEGELRILLDEIDCRYYIDDEISSAKYFRNSCFYPGDLAIKREDGRIRILGRTDDVLNIQGNKAAVAPIEQWIQSELSVDEVCVFSWLSEIGEDVLIVAIETQSEISESSKKNVSTQFSQFTNIYIATFSAFPRTEGGMKKVNRRKLKNHIFKELSKISE